MPKSISPATLEPIETYEEMSEGEVKNILSLSHEAFPQWRGRGFSDRARLFERLAGLLEEGKDAHAVLMAREMGKPVKQGVAEIEKCAWACRHYAEHAEAYLGPRVIESDAAKSYVTYNALGPILIIMPWNFPFWQTFRCAAPAMMAGNTMVLKHASNVSGCALAIEEAFREAGFPEHAFRTLIVPNTAVEAVIKDPRIRGVSLTGSTGAGKKVASQAGSVVKPVVLELGGSDPFIVLADAELDLAAELGCKSRVQCAGQSCIAAKRFIVVRAVHDAFVDKLRQRMEALKVGDPLDEETEMGPLVSVEARDSLHKQVEESVRRGARFVTGGQIPEGVGAYYPPTILTGVKRGMPAFDEELFGPVAAVCAAADVDEAIALANDTSFGLGANIFSRDVAAAERIAAERLEAGCCFVNAFVKSDPRLPFGGIKESGVGRELGEEGIREFVNTKTVYVAG